MTDANPGPRRQRRGIYLLPNLFTTAALFAGFYAIVAAMDARFEAAAAAIFVAMVLDGADGRIARMTNTQSAFGAEYDSLSDVICFGYQLFAYREVPQASTGFSPFELLYGRLIRGPLDIKFLRESWEGEKKTDESVVSHILSICEKMESMSELA